MLGWGSEAIESSWGIWLRGGKTWRRVSCMDVSVVVSSEGMASPVMSPPVTSPSKSI